MMREGTSPRGKAASSSLAMAGDIGALGSICDLIAFIHQSRATGALHTYEGEGRRTIYFKDGETSFAQSNEISDRLGQILYRYGVVTRRDLDQAMVKVGPTRHIGQVLIDQGSVSAHDVFVAVRKQVEEIFGWGKTIGGLRKTRYRGRERTGLWAYMVGSAYNLLRMAKLLPGAAVT